MVYIKNKGEMDMSLLKEWEELSSKERTKDEYDRFWKDYLTKEQNIYEYILENRVNILNGTVKELAEKFGMDVVNFTGFVYGINTSLVSAIDLESLDENSDLNMEIDFEKLYYNMLEAKASWLFNLPQWDNILTEERRKEIKKEFNRSKIVVNENKIGRNDPCPCGSGKKYKKCCGK